MSRLTYKQQSRSLVREGAPLRQDNKFQTQTLEKEAISGQTSIKWARHQDILTVSRKVTLTEVPNSILGQDTECSRNLIISLNERVGSNPGIVL
jgi:hypothetical protein